MSEDTQHGLRDLVAKMVELQAEKEILAAKVKENNEALDYLRLKQIPELMEALGIKNATYEGLGRVQLASDLYANTKEGQKDAGIQWLRDCGYDNMITEGYNASSLKALFRRMIVDGAEIPGEIFNVTPFTRASVVQK